MCLGRWGRPGATSISSPYLDDTNRPGGSIAVARLCVISPMHNEGSNVERVVAGMRAQRRAPDVWVIVDDQSTDDTLARAQAATAGLDYVRVVSFERPPIRTKDRLAHALEAESFNYGLRVAGGADAFDYVAKLDGDVVLPPDYYSTCLAHLERSPEVGLVCGQLRETIGGATRIIAIPSRHVHGALKLYRRECFEAIGGMREQLGWDAIDEIYARMNGFATVSLPGPIGEHLRPVGSGDGILRGRARHGLVAYITHFPWYWVAGRSIKLARVRPPVLSGLAFLWGYSRAALQRVERVDDAAFRAFARRELWLRTVSFLPGAARLKRRRSSRRPSAEVRRAEG
jgi:biofilm PGA synthesis N-glycosyltransferase PgaC